MSDFNLAVNYALKNEGGLEENAADPGGITNMGISLRFLRGVPIDKLRKYGFAVDETIEANDIRHLTLDQAKALYKGEFWDHALFSSINTQSCCNYIFDMVINMGLAPAIKCAQRACWAVMKQHNIVPDDGILNNTTLDMINHCGVYLLAAMRSERAGYYRLIVSEHASDREFINGWLNRAYNS